MKQRIVIIDDDEAVSYSLGRLFAASEREIEAYTDPIKAREIVKANPPDLVLLDIKMPGVDGLDILADLHRHNPLQLCVIMTAHGTIETVVTALKNGAFDYLIKPFDVDELKATVERALEAARLQRHVDAKSPPREMTPVDNQPDRIIGRSAPMQRVFKAIAQIAPRDVPVLVRGESGTGKELVTRAVWSHSKRSQKPFLAVNCAALPENLLETELFGHEKGAFTGAHERRLGKFEVANGGTLFLDEVGDMSLPMQAKILRVVQEGTFERVGGSKTIAVNVRLLTATNIDLEKAIRFKRFREDLYYRLRVFEIRLPALRERPDDIPELANYFLARFRTELDCPAMTISWKALDMLKSAPWPGNVRELENVMRRAMVVCRSPSILATDIDPILLQGSGQGVEAEGSADGAAGEAGSSGSGLLATPGELALRARTPGAPGLNPPEAPEMADAEGVPASTAASSGAGLPVSHAVSAAAIAAATAGSGAGLAEAVDGKMEQLAGEVILRHPGEVLDAVERVVIRLALEREEWNIQRAAKLLGVARTTLRSRIARHKIKKHLKAQ
ncbi:MAG TPA: sigma-54 dependent transcriptional regulator [Planctomycetota bacterium]|nr:sigma-54 dependent transcriptional regulator [Planctomycetota bacterium]